jgi:soluble lytic murein transglycosylase-like protein
LAALCLGAFAAPASAAVPHVVQPGETLWSIAAANNLYTNALAVYNGLSADSNVVLGSTILVPTGAEALPKVNAALAAQGAPQPAGQAVQAAAPAATASGPPPAGAYTVRAGDTFSALAARAGVRPEQVAGVNGLDVDAPLLAGTIIKLPPGTGGSATAATTAAAAPVVPQADPAPTPGRVTSTDIRQVAGQHGVDGSLASAIAWQESGFNNAMVSSANARGVMQVMPGTWDWVQRNLAQRRLDPASPVDNVHAGTLYLGQLLKETGGDPVTAAAGYYQGLSSVRKIGMLPETRQYVNNVMALRSRFGG